MGRLDALGALDALDDWEVWEELGGDGKSREELGYPGREWGGDGRTGDDGGDGWVKRGVSPLG